MRILVVDDSEDDALLIRRAIEQSGVILGLTLATVGTEIDLRTALLEPWDVLVVDYILPNMPWPMVMNIAREIQPEIAIVVISGSMTDDRGRAAVAEGAQDYLPKSGLTQLAVRAQMAVETRRAWVANNRAADELKVKHGTGPLVEK